MHKDLLIIQYFIYSFSKLIHSINLYWASTTCQTLFYMLKIAYRWDTHTSGRVNKCTVWSSVQCSETLVGPQLWILCSITCITVNISLTKSFQTAIINTKLQGPGPSGDWDEAVTLEGRTGEEQRKWEVAIAWAVALTGSLSGPSVLLRKIRTLHWMIPKAHR